jgi:hypothetical protein
MQYQTFDTSSGSIDAAAPREEPTVGPLDPQAFGRFSPTDVAGSIAPTFAYASPSPFELAPADSGVAPLFTPQAPVAQRLTLPVRVGPVRFASSVEESALSSGTPSSFDTMSRCGTADPNGACAALRQQDSRVAAGTSFDVRAGQHHLNVNLGGSLEHQSLPDETSFPYIPLDPQSPQASTQAAPLRGGSAISYPNLVDVTKHGLNANVALPVTTHVTVDVGYDTQHLQGGYTATNSTVNASTLVPGIDARKETYLGNITYQLPHTNSAITFSARQYRYQDNFIPNLNLTQTRADVNFTVKF